MRRALTRKSEVMKVLHHGGYIITGGQLPELFNRNSSPIQAWVAAVKAAQTECRQISAKAVNGRMYWELAS